MTCVSLVLVLIGTESYCKMNDSAIVPYGQKRLVGVWFGA